MFALFQLSFWNVFGVMNIATDVFLVAWPSLLIYGLHTSLSRRIPIIACFASRLMYASLIKRKPISMD